MVKIHLKKKDVLLTVLEFLKSSGYIESMRCLEHECGVSVDNYGNDLDFLRDLILDGQWEDAENFVNPLQKKNQGSEFDFDGVMFQLRKQRFLELVDGKDQEGAVLELTAGLKALEGSCSREEFNKLCYCLTLESLTDHPDYASWTPYQGRMECFTLVKGLFDRVFAGEWAAQRDAAERVMPNHLITLLQQSALYQASLYMASTSTTSLPNPIHFDVLSQTFRPQDASGNSSARRGMQMHEPQLLPGNVMRHLQRKLGAGGLTGAPIPVPGVIMEGMTTDGPGPPRASPGKPRRGAGTAGQPLRSSWGYGNGRNGLTATEISKIKQMANEVDKPREPLPLKDAYKHAGKKATTWEIPLDTADSNQLNGIPLSEDGETNEEEASYDDANERVEQSTDADAKEEGGECAIPKTEPIRGTGHIVKEVPEDAAVPNTTATNPPPSADVVVEKREGALGPESIRRLTCLAMSTESQPIRTVSFSPNGKNIAIGTNGCALKICSVPSEAQCDQIAKVINRSVPATLKMRTEEEFEDLHLGSVYSAAWSLDGSLIATGSNDMTVKIVKTGGKSAGVGDVTTFTGHDGTVRDVSFCGDNNRIVSAGAGNFGVYVWDLGMATEEGDGDPLMILKGHTNTVMALNCGISGGEGNAMVLSAGMDRTIRLWDLRFGSCVALLGCIGVGDRQGSGEVANSEKINESAIVSLACSPVTPWTVASGHMDGTICVWDIRAQRLAWSLHAHSDEVRSVDFSNDGRWLLSGSFDQTINCTDTDVWERRIVNTFAEHKNKVLRSIWHTSRPMFASCSADKTVRLWGPSVKASQ
jgi:hypothetical protein